MTSIQLAMREWRRANFSGAQVGPLQMTLGVCEEAGELAHAILKRDQGIRGFDKIPFFAKHARDAIGDIIIYLMGVCDHFGWDIYEVVQETSESVLKRNWKEDRDHGGEEDPSENR